MPEDVNGEMIDIVYERGTYYVKKGISLIVRF